MIRPLGLLLILFTCTVFGSGTDTVPVSETYILLDLRTIEDGDLARIFTAEAQAYALVDWIHFSTAPTTSLVDVLSTQYNLKANDATIYPQTYQAVWSFITEVNHLKQDEVPSSLLLPRLPSIPNRGARTDLVQVQHPTTGYSVAALSGFFSRQNTSANLSIALREAARVAFLNTSQFRASFNRQGSSHFSRGLYMGPMGRAGAFPLIPLSTQSCDARMAHSTPVRSSIPDALKARIAQIPVESAGYLYVLDFDVNNPMCSHGRKVKDVVTGLLKTYGAAHLADNVRLIELNYFAHPEEVRKTISTILDTVVDNSLLCHYKTVFAESFNSHLDSCDTPIDAIPLATPVQASDDLTVPGYYLYLVYEYILDSSAHASVISSSFFTITNGFEIASSAKHGLWPALVTAVLNPQLSPSYVDELTQEQPAKRFFEIRRDFGTFLVGATLRDGSVFGMTSTSESFDQFSDAVTTFALGEGYGEVDPSSSCVRTCISPDDQGTSFATPAVAVQLFLARALWRLDLSKMQSEAAIEANEVKIMEAKRRLELSATVVPDLVGKSASAGVPRLERLVLPAKGNTDILIRVDGSVETSPVRTAFASFNVSDTGPSIERQYPWDFSGVQRQDGKLFIYDESRHAWRRASDDEHLHVELDNGRVYNSASDFFAIYQSLVRYK